MENFRYLKIMTPIIIIGGIMDTTAMIGVIIQMHTDITTQLYCPVYMIVRSEISFEYKNF